MFPNPCNVYGKTKLLGEKYASTSHKHYILRTSWLFGNGKNFVRTMLNLGKTHKQLSIVCDQFGSPTSCACLSQIIEQFLEKKPPYGIYHTTNEGFTSWFEFAQDVFRLVPQDIKLIPIHSEEYLSQAKRPKNSKLSKEKLHAIGIFPEHYLPALERYLQEEQK